MQLGDVLRRGTPTQMAVQMPAVVRDWSQIVYDEAKHPRGYHGRFIGGAGKDALDTVRELEHVHKLIDDTKYHAYAARQSGGRRAGQEVLRNVTYGPHQGIEAIQAHEKALKQQLNALVRQMSPRDLQEMQALQKAYYAHSSGQYRLLNIRDDDPRATVRPEYIRLRDEYYRMIEVAKAYNREQRKLWAEEQREGKPPKWGTTQGAWKKAEKAVGPKTVNAIEQHLHAMNEQARGPYEAEQARIREENRQNRLRDEIARALSLPHDQVTAEQIAGWETDRERIENERWEAYAREQDARARELLPVVTKSLFGREMTKEELVAKLGFSPTATVKVVPGHYVIDEQNAHDEIEFHITDGHFTGDFRLLRTGNGDLLAQIGTVENAAVKAAHAELNKPADQRNPEKLRGLNAAMDGRQIIHIMQGFQHLGVRYVTCTAARGSGANGYYTWPRMGFMGDIPERAAIDTFTLVYPLREAQKVFGSDVTRVEQLFALPGGQQWWREHGVTFPATFDFTDGSHSRQIFDRFVRALERANEANRMLYPNVTMDDAFDRAADEAWSKAYPPGSKPPQSSKELLRVEAEMKQFGETEQRAETPIIVALAQRLADVQTQVATVLRRAGYPLRNDKGQWIGWVSEDGTVHMAGEGHAHSGWEGVTHVGAKSSSRQGGVKGAETPESPKKAWEKGADPTIRIPYLRQAIDGIREQLEDYPRLIAKARASGNTADVHMWMNQQKEYEARIAKYQKELQRLEAQATVQSNKPAPQPRAPKAPRKTASEKAAEHIKAIHQALEDWRSGKAYYSNGNYRLHTEPSQVPTGKWGGKSIPAPWNKAAKLEFADPQALHRASELPSYNPKRILPVTPIGTKPFNLDDPRNAFIQNALKLHPKTTEGQLQGARNLRAMLFSQFREFTERGHLDWEPDANWQRQANIRAEEIQRVDAYIAHLEQQASRPATAEKSTPTPSTSATKHSGTKATSGGKTKQSDLYDTARNVTLSKNRKGETIYDSPTLPLFLSEIRDNPRSVIGDGAILVTSPKDVSKIFVTAGNIEKDRELQAAEQARRDASPIYKHLQESGEVTYYRSDGHAITIRHRFDMVNRLPVYDVFLNDSKRPAKGYANLLWMPDRVLEFIQQTAPEGATPVSTDRAATPDLTRLALHLADVQAQVARLRREGAEG